MGKASDYYGFECLDPSMVWRWLDNKVRQVERPDHVIDIHRRRLSVFRQKGVQCIGCKIKGRFFRSEVHDNDEALLRWYFNPLDNPPPRTHLNLYAVTGKGRLVMMTVDHLIPLSLGIEAGGTNEMSNLAPMCVRCNTLKGNDPKWHIDLPRNKRGQPIGRPHRQVKVAPSVRKEKRMPWNA